MACYALTTTNFLSKSNENPSIFVSDNYLVYQDEYLDDNIFDDKIITNKVYMKVHTSFYDSIDKGSPIFD